MRTLMKCVGLLVALMVLAPLGESMAFEGRMAGMADPYGLIYDDSDFLIHPSKIAEGGGVTYYGYYKFTYTDVGTWRWRMHDVSGAFDGDMSASGDRFDHDVLVGAALPMGAGRFGFFFNYVGSRLDADGNAMIYGWPGLNVTNDADNFTFRAIYGMPVGGSFKIGAEAQIGYHTETASTLKEYSEPGFREILRNYLWDDFPLVWPHDYSYWDYRLKASLEGDIGPATFGATVRGGSIISGDNEMNVFRTDYVDRGYVFNLNGDVNGYDVGSDIWLRYPVSKSLALPFLFRIDYGERSYDGGPSRGLEDWILDSQLVLEPLDGLDVYKNETDILRLEVGGGADYTLPSGLRLAAGLYYGFIKTDVDIDSAYIHDTGANAGDTYLLLFNGYPHATEHQLKLRIAAEKPLSANSTVRAGLEAFHGWVRERYLETEGTLFLDGTDDLERFASGTLTGTHVGITGSIGMSVKYGGVEFEPFIQGGWQRLDLDDDHATIDDETVRIDRERESTMVAAGLAVKF